MSAERAINHQDFSPRNSSGHRNDLTLNSKYSHARRAADAHSIIFEEDLDSEGELERSTYQAQKPVKNFNLHEERIGQSIVEHDDSETDRVQ